MTKVERRKRVAELCEQGVKIAAIAKEVGASYQTVHSMLVGMGLHETSGGMSLVERSKSDRRVLELARTGLPLDDICKETGRSRGSVRNVFFAHSTSYKALHIESRRERVKELRSKGMTLQQMADTLHCGRVTISDDLRHLGLQKVYYRD